MESWRPKDSAFALGGLNLRNLDLRLSFLTLALAYAIYRYVRRSIHFRVWQQMPLHL